MTRAEHKTKRWPYAAAQATCPWDQQKVAQAELIHWTQEFRAFGA